MILDDARKALRQSNTAFDTEISDLISAARQDMITSGIIADKANDDTDPLIKRAIITYCRANFGLNNPNAKDLQESYDMLKTHMALSMDYNMLPEVVV